MASVNAEVVVRNNNVDYALKQLKRKMKDAGTMMKFEEKLTYEKPSVKKRRKKIQSIRRAQYEAKEQEALNR